MQALWMVLGAFLFATMSVVVKIASQWFNSGEMVLGRGLIGIVFLWLLARNRCASRSPPNTPACTPGAAPSA
jgi:drug/metabolite transporter (DMT)-like permease